MRKYLKLITITALLTLSAAAAYSGDSDEARDLFYKGNAGYGEGRFDEAASFYEKALAAGYESGPLYYNLGNAYFKKGLKGKAILNYLRAKRIMPRDADLNSNLEYARSLVKGGFLVPDRNFLTRVFLDFAGWFSLRGITLICSAIYLLLTAFIIMFIAAGRRRRRILAAAGSTLLVLIVCLFVFFIRYGAVYIEKEAVIMSQNSDSKFEPRENATTFFTLYEGESVSVTESRDDWVKIKRVDGKQGWIKKVNLEML